MSKHLQGSKIPSGSKHPQGSKIPSGSKHHEIGKPSIQEHKPKLENPQKIQKNKMGVGKPNEVKNPNPKQSNNGNKKPVNSKNK